MKYLVVFLILVITTTVLCGCLTKHTYEYFDSQYNGLTSIEVMYPPREHVQKHVLTSSFFKALTPADLRARTVPSLEQSDYAFEYVSSYITFTELDRDKIDKSMLMIRQLLKDFPKLLNTRWNFVKMKSNIENGYPHTIGDMIILNHVVMQYDPNQFAKTIIHEKFHVMQRLYPLYFQELYKTMKFSSIKLSSIPPLKRSNPDLDGSLYIHEPSQTIPVQLYTSGNPSSLAQSSPRLIDVDGYDNNRNQLNNTLFGLPKSFYCQLEHPAEISACLLTEIITNEAFLEKEKNNTLVREARVWLLKHFS
jgi:hypothetical protein